MMCIAYSFTNSVGWDIEHETPRFNLVVGKLSCKDVRCVCVRSPMTRVVKVLTAAARNRWRAARRRKEARARTGYSGPVNLPPGALDGHPGIGAAMARVHSYEWLQSAAEQPEEDGARFGTPCK